MHTLLSAVRPGLRPTASRRSHSFRRMLLPALAAGVLFSGSAWALEPADCPMPVERLTLSKAVDQALCVNPGLHSYRFDSAASRADIDAAKAGYLPTLSATASSARLSSGVQSNDQALALKWLLWDFGARDATVSAAKATLSASEAKEIGAAQDLALDVAKSFFQLQANKAALGAAVAQVTASQKALDLADARHRAGEAIKLDVLQAQSALSQALVAKSQAQTALATQQAYFAMLLAVPAETANLVFIDETPVELSPSLPTTGLAELVRTAKERRTDLVASAAQVTALERKVEAARSEYLPTVTLNGTFQRSGVSDSPASRTNSIGISVNIPIFSGGETRAKVSSLRAQADAQADRLAAAKNQAGYEVVAAYEAVKSSVDQLSAAESLSTAAKEAYDQALARYRAGVGTMLEVFNALSQQSSAQETLISAQLGYRLSRAQLAHSLGEMPISR